MLWSLQGRSDYKRTYARTLWKKKHNLRNIRGVSSCFDLWNRSLENVSCSISELLQIKISWGRGGKRGALCPHTPLAACTFSTQFQFSTPLLYTHQGWVEAGLWADHQSTRASVGSQKPRNWGDRITQIPVVRRFAVSALPTPSPVPRFCRQCSSLQPAICSPSSEEKNVATVTFLPRQ